MYFYFIIAVWILVGIIALRLFLSFVRLLYAIYQGKNRVYLKISLPRKETQRDREEQQQKDFREAVAVMEQLYRSLHELSELDLVNFIHTRIWNYDNISFEIVCKEKKVFFYVVTQERHLRLVEKQLTSYYPDAEIERVERYNVRPENSYFRSYYMYLKRAFYFPIKTYKYLGSDSLNDLTNVFSGMDANEVAAIQLVMDPLNTKGLNKKASHIASMRFKGTNSPGWVANNILTRALGALFFGFTRGDSPTQAPGAQRGDSYIRMVQSEEEIWKNVGEKSRQPFFDCTVRITAAAPSKKRVVDILNSIMISFNCFMDEGLNYFQARRTFPHDWLNNLVMHPAFNLRLNGTFVEKSSIMTPEESASVYHFPNALYNSSPVISWSDFKTLSPPDDLPASGLLLGNCKYRGKIQKVYMNEKDRARHMYIIGQSGTGKSAFISYMARQDAMHKRGFCLIDPHGDLVENVLNYVPQNRIKDVVVFNPADHRRPLGLNLLDATTTEQMDMASSQATEIFIKIFGDEIFGPRIQHYFRNGCLTLMENVGEGATLIDVPRLFVDEQYRKYRTSRLINPVVKSFWEHEYASTAERERKEIIPYFTAKFGPFITNTVMRNIIGQQHSSFDFRKIMDEGKILLINLAKGDIGSINTQLLGLIVVSKIQMAALSRTNIPESERKQFYLYIDEFQNFATDSLCSILSEARKYKLSMIMAHQYLQQITNQGKNSIRDAVFGNVGTVMAFKIGAEDAQYMSKEFAPIVSEQDLLHVAKYTAYVKMNIDSTTSRPFHLKTIWDETRSNPQLAGFIKRYARIKHGRKKQVVDFEVAHRIGLND